MPILLATPLLLFFISKMMFQAPKQAGFHFLLAYQYLQAGGILDSWQSILSYGEDVPFWAMIIYFGVKRKSYQDRPNFATLDGARIVAFCCAAYQLNAMYWAAQLCGVQASCHSPAEYWAYSPIFLVISLALGLYFSSLLKRATTY